jgi:hypothetical protein
MNATAGAGYGWQPAAAAPAAAAAAAPAAADMAYQMRPAEPCTVVGLEYKIEGALVVVSAKAATTYVLSLSSKSPSLASCAGWLSSMSQHAAQWWGGTR